MIILLMEHFIDHKNGCVVWPFEWLIQVTRLDEQAGLHAPEELVRMDCFVRGRFATSVYCVDKPSMHHLLWQLLFVHL
jgi:hypothetical protein